jgi:nitrate/nitrite-specific signal transduction histidine kinase
MCFVCSLEVRRREELEQLSARLKEMEGKWEELYHQHQQVVEERCELEEAENDSRLKAQT